MSKMKRHIDEPNMSDTTILMKLEDLINIAMGPPEKNIINYKMIQTVLHILARQMRMLETHVEVRIREHSPIREKTKKKREDFSTESSSSKSPKSKRAGDAKEEGRRRSGSRRGSRERGKEKVLSPQGKEIKDQIEGSAPKDKDEKGVMSKDKKGKDSEADKSAAKDDKLDKKEKKKHEKAKETGKKVEKVMGKDKEDESDKKDDSSSPRDHAKTGQVPSTTSIEVTEVERDKEKVLLVERGPIFRIESRPRVGSIEVVTITQFARLEAEVKDLRALASPLPTPTIPDNEKIKTGIIKGTASLTEMMKTMQVSARIQAAEQAVSRMADLLTQLASAGAIPQELVKAIRDMKAEADRAAAAGESAGGPRKSVAIESADSPESTATQPSKMTDTRPSVDSKTSATSVTAQPVTRKEMDEMLESLKEELMKNMHHMSAKAASSADTAAYTAKNVADKLGTALAVNTRLNTLHSLVADYSEQLSGFDAGLTTQMQSFKEQIVQIDSDLKNGLKLMEKANNSGETAAIMELTERYEGLVSDLEQTTSAHQGLTHTQAQLEDQLQKMLECIEMLREQKADRDEVADGLRDKADISRLAGLLSELDFAQARSELERRLELCHEKFNKQEAVWMGAISDLTSVMESKAQLMQLLSTKDEVQQRLEELQEKLRKLAVLLGDPKAAMLTRKLCRDATCGACMAPALMELEDANFGAPPPLPALHPAPAAPTDDICFDDFKPEDHKARHICHRWVGGSHTLISGASTRGTAPPVGLNAAPTKKYTGYGMDGRLYMLEEELLPCLECNALNIEKEDATSVPGPRETGAGDQGSNPLLTIQPKTVEI
ncbi:uncharacterized protein LOC114250143 [Bombyx mandarina]|uniref:Uncharacterized protein LOC114250143 n=1 Tax=Bombyx mandarina TaxID=7092 RepID=A0A6J2KBM9_BOMMA|nr:uncharacterized protein LOC114250143 [Bombyx mandarina]